MPQPRQNVDIKGFGEVIKQLSKMSGKAFEQTLETEVGHVVKSTIQKTPISSIKGRKSKGKVKGGIVPRHIPQGLKRFGGDGGRKISIRYGKTFHVGEPILLRQNPDERVGGKFGKNYLKGARKRKKRYMSPSGKWPLRGGKVWLFPKGPWMGRAKFWDDYVREKEDLTKKKIKNIGLTAGQFYWMSRELGLVIPGGKVKGQKELRKTSLRSKVIKYISPQKIFKKGEGSIKLESKGLKVSAYNQVQSKLVRSAKSRVSFFKKAVKNDFIKDVKFKTKYYPLLYK
jgi:hypothetical protein